MTNQEIIQHLYQSNKPQYNLIKAAEEASELATVLLQYALKPNKVDTQEVIDEIGDVQIRIDVLKKIFGDQAVTQRIDYKLSKYKEYNQNKRFENI